MSDEVPEPTLSDLLNQPVDSFEYQGQTYKLRELDFGQMAQMESWIIERTDADLVRLQNRAHQGIFPQSYVDARIRQHDLLIGSGGYSFQGPAGVIALQSVPGQTYALYLAMQKDHPEITELDCRKIVMLQLEEVAKKLAKVLDEPPKSSAPGAFSAPGATSAPGSPTKGSRKRRKMRPV